MVLRFITVCLTALTVLFLFVSCGGPPNYTAPVVTGGNVVQSECAVYDEGDVPEESVEVKTSDGDILITHFNILLPENTLMGIIDVDGFITYERLQGYYYLEAGDQFINIREKFKLSSSEINCLYDFTIRISNVSGGTYFLSIYNYEGVLIHSSEVRVR